MSRAAQFATGVGVGMGLMYWIDPNQGNRRRKLLRDRAGRTVRRSRAQLGKAGRDLAHRARGGIAAATQPLREQFIDDATLVERVRARLGHLVSHPRALEVEARDGCVILRGPVLQSEVRRLMRGVQLVAGVVEVLPQLTVYARPDRVSSLQGGAPATRGNVLLGNAPPGVRLAFGVAGGLLAASALQRRRVAGVPLAVAGATLLMRALAPDPRRLVRGWHLVTKTLHIGAPMHTVFGAWSRYENFPRFMRHLIEVRDLGNGRSRWVARGPAGLPVQWDAMITHWEPGRLIAWQSLAGARVPNAGSVRFASEPGGTRVEIRLHYLPPAGMLGAAVARLFGADPRSEMDEDLQQLKSTLEGPRAVDANGASALAGAPA